MSATRQMEVLRDILAEQLATTSRILVLDPNPPAHIVRQAEVLDRLIEIFPQVAEACRDDRGRAYAMRDLPRQVSELLSQARHNVSVILKAHSTQP